MSNIITTVAAIKADTIDAINGVADIHVAVVTDNEVYRAASSMVVAAARLGVRSASVMLRVVSTSELPAIAGRLYRTVVEVREAAKDVMHATTLAGERMNAATDELAHELADIFKEAVGEMKDETSTLHRIRRSSIEAAFREAAGLPKGYEEDEAEVA